MVFRGCDRNLDRVVPYEDFEKELVNVYSKKLVMKGCHQGQHRLSVTFSKALVRTKSM